MPIDDKNRPRSKNDEKICKIILIKEITQVILSYYYTAG